MKFIFWYKGQQICLNTPEVKREIQKQFRLAQLIRTLPVQTDALDFMN